MFNKISYPIIQAPMAGGILTPELVAAVSNAGMLGSIATGYLGLNECEKFILDVKSLTAKPFIVNIFIEEDRLTTQKFPKPLKVIELEQKLNIYKENFFLVPPNISQSQYAQLLIKHQVAAVSTTFGMFSPEIIKQFKQNNIKVIANCTTASEALYAAKNGADALIIQGTEAGGHQSSFLSNQVNNLSTLELFKQIQALNLKLFLIVAGGINLKNIDAYWQAGADMVQLGTLFMLSDLSSLNKETQNYIIDRHAKLHTKLSSAITGKWVRGIDNFLMKQLDNADYQFPIQHYATSHLRVQTKKLNKYDYMGIWLGEHDNLQLTSTEYLINQLKKLSVNKGLEILKIV